MTAWVMVVVPAPTPVTAICCGVFQLLEVNVSALDTVALAVSLEVGVTTTVPPGSLASCTS